jgi:hypothetical protein
MALKSKKIRILESGPINALGGIQGPILSYYRETMATIFQLVRDGVNVIELTPDGSEIPLNIQNYDKELGGTYAEVDIDTPPVQEPVKTPVVEADPAPVVKEETKDDAEEVVEEPVTEEVETPAPVSVDNNRNNKNKHKR